MCHRYLIAATPRSGSSYLCDLLNKSGAAGMRSATGVEGWEYLGRHCRVDPGRPSALQIIEDALRRSELGGVQGFKVMWRDWASLLARCTDEAERQRLRDELAEIPWVRLRRRDQIAQAVSWAKAVQTQQWNSTKTPLTTRVEYNYLFISRRLADAKASEQGWDCWFEELGVVPLELVYEDYIRDPAATLSRIGLHLGVENGLSCRPEATNLRRQRTTDNQVWQKRFVRDRRNIATRAAAMVRSGFAPSTWREVRRRLLERGGAAPTAGAAVR